MYKIAYIYIIQMKQSSGDSIKVFIRVRPLNEKEKNTQSCVSFNPNEIQMSDKQPDHRFSFDHIFGYQSKQKEVYDLVGHQVVESAFQGFNGTVFAYGQTSSGKTHTCIGPDYNDPENQGILPRMVKHIFQKIQKAPTYVEFRIKVSIVEIYLEKIKDLLDTHKTDLKIREKVGKGIYIQDVTEEYVASSEETLDILRKGIGNRSVGQTNMNDTSSRSHMAFIITLYQNNLKDASAKSGKIILVDLAGSEKVSKTGAEGKLLDEAKQINKSLSALGNVINSLTDNKLSHIPYRDSKLTRLLQQSLGGNSKTHLVINVSPSQANQHQTLSSLRFGNRAKQIKNKPKINKEYTVAELLLLLEKAEKRIQQLEQYIKEMNVDPNTSIRKKKANMRKSNQVFVENLLDSDNPILESEHEAQLVKDKDKEQIVKILQIEDEGQLNRSVNKSINKSKLKLHFQSQYQQSESQAQTPKHLHEKPRISGEEKLKETNQQLVEEKQILCEEIQELNMEKVQMVRELDIMTEKYELMAKQTKINANKIHYLAKENQKLLEKAVNEGLAYQESLTQIKDLERQIEEYEAQILKLAALQQVSENKDKAIMNMFGTAPKSKNTIQKNDKLAQQTKRMVQIVKKNKSKKAMFDDEEEEIVNSVEDRISKQINENAARQKEIEELQRKLKDREQQLSLFEHLQAAKQAFIKEKLEYLSQKQRLYKDLENRIQKVLELEEKLDESAEKIKYYEDVIKMGESEKNRKLTLLQRHLNEVSENYYVLKGQQSSWVKNNQKIESKIEKKNKRIIKLEKEVMSLREQVQNLKLQIQDLEDQQQDRKSMFDLDFSRIDEQLEQNNEANKGNIVKVVRSTQFSNPQQIFG